MTIMLLLMMTEKLMTIHCNGDDDDDDDWYVNLPDINNGARASLDYQIIPIGSERAAADFLMRMTMTIRRKVKLHC